MNRLMKNVRKTEERRASLRIKRTQRNGGARRQALRREKLLARKGRKLAVKDMQLGGL